MKQTNVSFEIIVGDDCSTDRTERLVRAFSDKRIKYFRNKIRLGTSNNFRKCFLHATGKYIFTLGDDDIILYPQTLSDILKIMNRNLVGMGKIGAVGYDSSPKDPYQAVTMGSRQILVKPNTHDVLTKSIDFGLGYYSGLIFNTLFLDKRKLKADHVCKVDHMCQAYHSAAYDLIKNHGIIYMPNFFIVSHLSVSLIPRYFNIRRHGRLFMEEPVILAREYVSDKEYESYKKAYLRRQLVLLPNIRLFTDSSNYMCVLERMIYLDKSLLRDPAFIFWTCIGFLPRFVIRGLRLLGIFLSKKQLRKFLFRHKYFYYIQNLLDASEKIPVFNG